VSVVIKKGEQGELIISPGNGNYRDINPDVDTQLDLSSTANKYTLGVEYRDYAVNFYLGDQPICTNPIPVLQIPQIEIYGKGVIHLAILDFKVFN
jgi:hypothetical protein